MKYTYNKHIYLELIFNCNFSSKYQNINFEISVFVEKEMVIFRFELPEDNRIGSCIVIILIRK